MSLSSRFGLDVVALLAGGFLAVVAVAFTAPTAGWIGFGVFTGLTLLGGVGAVLARQRGARLGHGVLGLVGLWSLIAALVFTGSLLTWLVFADALAVVLVGLADLAAHEMTTERVVHQLEVHEARPVAA
jgi:hypothetical protein